MPERPDWHGWAYGESALFISPLSDTDPRLALWIKHGSHVSELALFADEAAAREATVLMDLMLLATGTANSELLTRLGA